MYHLKNLCCTATPVFLFLAIASLFTNNVLAQSSNLTVSPAVVVFPNTPVGTDCPGVNCTYAMVTITNNGSQTEQLVTAEADSPFWPTYGGTCNATYAYYLPAGESCTFQWGFKPVHPGRVVGVGTVSFKSGASVGVLLTGVGNK